MRNGDLFIQKFNELDNLLHNITNLDRNIPFSSAVDHASIEKVTVRRHKDILKSIGRLRNAIVHYRAYPEKILADPRPEVIEELESVLAAIATPQKLIPKFQKSIRIFNDDNPLSGCLIFMKENNFSQIVVAHEGAHVLLSSEGIVKWLENARDVGLADLEETTIENVLEFEDRNICQYLSRDDLLDEAFEKFEQAISNGVPRLQAILISENGKPQERPLGIVTPWDLLSDNH